MGCCLYYIKLKNTKTLKAFSRDLNLFFINRFFLYSTGNRPIWEFGWAYGVGWGAAIFLFGAVVLLLCDKESEEIYYKERKIVHESQMRA